MNMNNFSIESCTTFTVTECMHFTLSCTVKPRAQHKCLTTFIWHSKNHPTLQIKNIQKFETQIEDYVHTHSISDLYIDGSKQNIFRILFFKHMYEIQINGVNICFRGDEILLRFGFG